MIRLFMFVLFILQQIHCKDPRDISEDQRAEELVDMDLQEPRDITESQVTEELYIDLEEQHRHMTEIYIEMLQHCTDTLLQFLDMDIFRLGSEMARDRGSYEKWYDKVMDTEHSVPILNNPDSGRLLELLHDVLTKVNHAVNQMAKFLITAEPIAVPKKMQAFLEQLRQYVFFAESNLNHTCIHLMTQHLMGIIEQIFIEKSHGTLEYLPTMKEIREEWKETLGDLDTIGAQLQPTDAFYLRALNMAAVYTSVRSLKIVEANFESKHTPNLDDVEGYARAMINFEVEHQHFNSKDMQNILKFKTTKIRTKMQKKCNEVMKKAGFKYEHWYIDIYDKFSREKNKKRKRMDQTQKKLTSERLIIK